MSWPTQESIAVEVVLDANSLSTADCGMLESRVADEVSGLIQDLGLPAVVQVRLVDQAHDDRQGSPRMAIAIEGQPCRQTMHSSDEGKTSGLSELVNHASAVLYANRHLLLTKRVLGAIATAHPAYVVGVVPEMVDRGLSLEVAASIAGKITPSLEVESRRYQVELLLSDSAPDTITVEAGEGLHQSLTEPDTSQFSNMIGMMRDGLFYELGVRFPPMRLVVNEALSAFDFRVNVLKCRGPILTGLRTTEFLVNAAAPNVENSLKTNIRPIRHPVTGVECSIVQGEDAASRCEREMNVTTWDAAGFTVLIIAKVLRAHADLLLTAAYVQSILAKLSEAFPLLIVNVLERFQPRFVLDVLRALVREGFSVRDLRGILEAMLELDGAISSVASDEIAIFPPSAKLSHWELSRADHQAARQCADSVRVAMKRYVTSQFAKRGEVTVLEISGAAEARLRGCQKPIRGPEQEWLLGTIAAEIRDGSASRPVVVLTAVDLRRLVREAIEIECPRIAVVCREELEEGIVWHDHRHLR